MGLLGLAENFSSGMGQGVTNQLRGLLDMAQHPGDYLRGLWQLGTMSPGELGPMVRNGLADMAREATSGPVGLGNVIGNNVSPRGLLGVNAATNALTKPGLLQEMTAYHGSPHDFDRFDSSKIGTGEGAQVYGHGLYFAESPEVAKIYSADRAYVGASMAGKPISINYDDPKWIAQSTIDEFRDPVKAKAHLEMIQRTAFKHQSAETRAGVQGAIELISSGEVKPKGKIYTVDIPDDAIEKMIDWDKPINEQNSFVKSALDRAGINIQSSALAGPMARGQESHLAKFGITGIKYLDEGSRGKGTGTRNFVVFDDKLPKVLKKE